MTKLHFTASFMMSSHILLLHVTCWYRDMLLLSLTLCRRSAFFYAIESYYQHNFDCAWLSRACFQKKHSNQAQSTNNKCEIIFTEVMTDSLSFLYVHYVSVNTTSQKSKKICSFVKAGHMSNRLKKWTSDVGLTSKSGRFKDHLNVRRLSTDKKYS